MANLLMYDAVDYKSMPAGANGYAGYVNGIYENFAEVRALHPNSNLVSISVFASGDAMALDVERGDATPPEVPAWMKRQLARGVSRPIVYASQSEVPSIIADLAAAGIARSRYRIWSAHYRSAHICGPVCGSNFTADGTQWEEGGPGFPHQYDTSELLPSFFTSVVTPPPVPVKPVPAPAPKTNSALVKELQTAVHVAADGKWGSGTDLALQWMSEVGMTGHLPGSIKTMQLWVGAKQDGVWGPASQAAFTATVKKIQTYLHVAADGAWGPKTQTAYVAARNANLNKFGVKARFAKLFA